MTARSYKLHGLAIVSDLALPEPEEPVGKVDLEIRRLPDATVPPLVGDLALQYAVGDFVLHEGRRHDEGGWTLHAPGRVGMAVAADGKTLSVWRDPSAPEDLLALLVAGMGISFVLSTRGELCLHASAVETHAGCIAFAAPSGGGKSTLATLACAGGAPFFADDVLRVELGVPVPRVYRGACEARLRGPSAPIAETWPGHSRTSVDDRTAVAPPRSSASDLPFAAIVLPKLAPTLADEADLELVRLRGDHAFVPLLVCLRILGWHDPVIVARQFDQLVEIAASVPIYGATIPWQSRPSQRLADAVIRRVLGGQDDPESAPG